MKNNDAFLTVTRETPAYRPVNNRIHDYQEVYADFAAEKTVTQATRCMDCGIPFCHHGCPLGNVIPEFNEAVMKEDWKQAIEILSATNNFPEFTGRICPAPCEASCVLGINNHPVAIEHIEKTIAEEAFRRGYIQPNVPKTRSGKKVAVVGSGPAGLSAAAQANKAGHSVVVFESADRIGGLLRYGIPDFKLEKWVLDRRIALMEREGIGFETGVTVGITLSAKTLLERFDAIILCGGSAVPHDLPIEGRNLSGIHFALDFLTQSNKARHSHLTLPNISATGKRVVVIGGGDTGSDCVGTSNRQGAKSVTQIDIIPLPPSSRRQDNPWPTWPQVLRTTSSHEEGCEREWGLLAKRFIGNEKHEVCAIETVNLEWQGAARRTFIEISGTEKIIPCDLVLFAMGYKHPFQDGALKELNVALSERGLVKDTAYQTNIEKVFTAGDMRRGQSLVVWAMHEGREAAREVDKFLNGGVSSLESKFQ